MPAGVHIRVECFLLLEAPRGNYMEFLGTICMHSVGQLCIGGRGGGGVDNLHVPCGIKAPGDRSLSFSSKGSPWNLVAIMSDVTALWCPNSSYNPRNHQLRSTLSVSALAGLRRGSSAVVSCLWKGDGSRQHKPPSSILPYPRLQRESQEGQFSS